MGLAIPYNGIDYKKYNQFLEDRKSDIDYIYIANNSVFENRDRNIAYTILQDDVGEGYYKDCEKFLESRPKDVPIFLDCTEFYHPSNYNSMKGEIESFLIPELDRYSFTGIITCDYGVASYIKNNTDYDVIIYGLSNLRAMYSYEEDIEVSDFILPLDTLRNRDYVEYLKKVKQDYNKNSYDAKFQAVVNNNRYYGDMCFNQDAYKVTRTGYMKYGQWNRPYDEFRKNWVLPRWLKIYDDLIETYIIEGLYTYSVEGLFKTVDAYIHRSDDILLSDIVSTRLQDYPVKDIKGKLARCMCRECDVSCTTCKDILSEYYTSHNIEV